MQTKMKPIWNGSEPAWNHAVGRDSQAVDHTESTYHHHHHHHMKHELLQPSREIVSVWDQIYDKTMFDPTWEHPFTCVVAGPTGCGKTEWVKRFIQHLQELVLPTPTRVV